MMAVHTSSAAQTQAVAAAFAALVEAGDLVLLTGDLGAGKTTFTQGLGRALGIEERIVSPTFTLHRRYEPSPTALGEAPRSLRLDHLDVYRLEDLAESTDLALAELLEGGGVVVIEWGDTIRAALPSDLVELRLRLGAGDDDRIIEILPEGSRWQTRRAALDAAIAPWVVPC